MSFFKFLTSKSLLIQIVISIIVFFALVFGVSKWLASTTNHTQKIQVPDLSKLTVDRVEVMLDEYQLRYEVIDSTNFHPDYPPLSVIEQSPAAGDYVKENRRIYLKINRPTYQDIIIPKVYGKPRRNAEATLKATGFKVGNNPKYTQDIAKDVVRGLYYKGKEVKTGDKLPKYSVLELKLGNGGDRSLLNSN